MSVQSTLTPAPTPSTCACPQRRGRDAAAGPRDDGEGGTPAARVRRGGRREAAEHRAGRRRRVESHADADAGRVAAGWLAGGGSEGERASAVGQAAGWFFGLGSRRAAWLAARRGVKRGWTAMGRVHARLIKA